MSKHKKDTNWQILLGLGLVALSAVLYFLHFLIFKDSHHIFIYLLGDIAFVPIEVLLVTLIIHRLLNNREKSAMLQKLNMVIGAFFSEVGTELLAFFAVFDPNAKEVSDKLIVKNHWSKKDFTSVRKRFKNYSYAVTVKSEELVQLREFLLGKRAFLLGLLENPNLLEHKSFTNLLWAVFHLTEELSHRKDINKIPDSDREHICGDLERVYSLLILEWLSYMQHLSKSYPYLFSLAMRTNPFDPQAKAEVS